MAKAGDISKGDRVRWRTSQGKTTGRVIRIMTKPFSIKGTDLKASKDDPKVLVESEKTGAQAGHKPSALEKLKGSKAHAGGGATKGAGKKKGTDDKAGAKAKDAGKAKAKAKAGGAKKKGGSGKSGKKKVA